LPFLIEEATAERLGERDILKEIKLLKKSLEPMPVGMPWSSSNSIPTLSSQLTSQGASGKFVQEIRPRSKSFRQMKPPKNMNLKSRSAEKMASRREDRRRLENGESPEVIQRENSIFPPGYFDGIKFTNLADAVGK